MKLTSPATTDAVMRQADPPDGPYLLRSNLTDQGCGRPVDPLSLTQIQAPFRATVCCHAEKQAALLRRD